MPSHQPRRCRLAQRHVCIPYALGRQWLHPLNHGFVGAPCLNNHAQPHGCSTGVPWVSGQLVSPSACFWWYTLLAHCYNLVTKNVLQCSIWLTHHIQHIIYIYIRTVCTYRTISYHSFIDLWIRPHYPYQPWPMAISLLVPILAAQMWNQVTGQTGDSPPSWSWCSKMRTAGMECRWDQDQCRCSPEDMQISIVDCRAMDSMILIQCESLNHHDDWDMIQKIIFIIFWAPCHKVYGLSMAYAYRCQDAISESCLHLQMWQKASPVTSS